MNLGELGWVKKSKFEVAGDELKLEEAAKNDEEAVWETNCRNFELGDGTGDRFRLGLMLLKFIY